MKIKSIIKVKPQRVYAVTTSTGTFIADNLAHHNCYICNFTLKGNWVEYEKVMIERFGEDKVAVFKRMSKKVVKYSVVDYQRIEQEYKDKLSALYN